jgi:predicted amidohydrolase
MGARVAVVQTDPAFGEVARNCAEIRERTAGLRADLVVLPELATSGYRFVSQEEASSLGEPAGDDAPTIRTFREVARETGATVVGGFCEQAGDGTLYNSAAVVYASGLLTVYRKLHLFGDERRWFAPGPDLPPVVHTPGGLRVGVMVCFDWLFPEVSRYLALEGADVIAHPANLVLPWCPDSMPVRCLENGVFAATADRVGQETRPEGAEPLRYIGRSQVVAPDGERLAALGETEPGVAIAEVDPRRARRPNQGAAGSIRSQRRADRLPLVPVPGPADDRARRWALARHDTPGGEHHFDLFIERAGRLMAWRLAEPPRPRLTARRSFCHRPAYLGFEGELSGGRGTVTRVDDGVAEVLEEGFGGGTYRLGEVAGQRLRLVVEAPDGDARFLAT